MTITFNSIPSNIRTPGAFVEVDPSNAMQGLLPWDQRVLILGQKTAAGTGTTEVLTYTPSSEKAETYWGAGSMLARMVKAFKAANPYIETWVIAQPDHASGVAATKTITVTGPATASGSLNLMIGGRPVTVSVTSGDAASAIAANIVTACGLDSWLPATAAAVDAVVTLTHRHKGEVGDDLDVRVNYYRGQELPSGVGVTVAAGTTGATNPMITNTIAAMGDEQFDYVVCPYTDATTLIAMETEMARRWNPMVQIPAGCWAAVNKSQTDLMSWCSTTRNSPFVSTLGIYDLPTPTEEMAAIYGAEASYNLNIDPARPLQRLTLTGALPPRYDSLGRFTRTERNDLLNNGISTFTVDAGGNMLIERAISNYQTNPAGTPDVAFLDMNTLYSLIYIRYQYRVRMLSRYPRHKLANDSFEVQPGQAIARPIDIRNETLAVFKSLYDAGIIENYEELKNALRVERNNSDVNRVDVLIPCNLVNQFRVLAAQIAYIL
ncbi:MAG: phage tail sheath subtilisin-like domain-containing protein [Planctomycetota bacterium]